MTVQKPAMQAMRVAQAVSKVNRMKIEVTLFQRLPGVSAPILQDVGTSASCSNEVTVVLRAE